MLGKIEGRRRRERQRMRWLDGITDSVGHEFEQIQGDSEGQGSLVPGAPQDEAGLTRKFETSHVGGATESGRTEQQQ